MRASEPSAPLASASFQHLAILTASRRTRERHIWSALSEEVTNPRVQNSPAWGRLYNSTTGVRNGTNTFDRSAGRRRGTAVRRSGSRDGHAPDVDGVDRDA